MVTWFKGTAITVALAVTMLGMGLTLELEDFIGRVVHSRPPGCQIGYMDLLDTSCHQLMITWTYYVPAVIN